MEREGYNVWLLIHGARGLGRRFVKRGGVTSGGSVPVVCRISRAIDASYGVRCVQAQRACQNIDGSFTCADCPAGWANYGDTGCRDIDECLFDNGGCVVPPHPKHSIQAKRINVFSRTGLRPAAPIEDSLT